ncbi:DUF2157 domain-containing protein [Pseudomonas daroniae]|uniref:DUF2157 domain-containing protein n=1 Tax=Phytopseudomonas daroniae TaxID=2487519 RepID=A0A4Q9QNM5_9GAMM|nr:MULTISPECIES: DUF2157 domain-containing protein [Pseudomonas]TBU80760.1 DUF2157 domain-containing protein [Pseudomonas daroniae]TBU81795.1 DUF2157 domain-containing protein [Pseudomonas sp. FRB 228]TBU90784.1 DUF2157 domain-containing protein [Pseudomonas daroniae]
MTLKIDSSDLTRAVQAGVLQPGQDQALLDFLRHDPQSRPSFQLSHAAYYFGALLIIGAMGWLLTEAWMSIGDTALLLISSAYLLLFLLGGRSLWQRGQPIPGGLLAAVAVSLTPLVVFAAQRVFGLWPLGDTQTDYVDYYRYVQGGWLAMEVATILVGLLVLRLMPFPFIVMPIAVALWFMSMDLSELLYGEYFSWEQRRWVSLWLGLVILLVSLLVDGRSKRDFAFWGYLAGLTAFWGGLSLMDSGSDLGKALYCLINLGLIGLAVLLRRPLFMVFGALGVAGYLGYLAHDVFEDSLLFPVVVSLIGLGVIGLGLLYQKRREAMTGALRRHLPASWQTFLPALRR